jgi:POT family proton-dependent oligopeptide transporter
MTDTVRRPGKTVFGHPIGLAYLCFAEAWERFSYYGMLALLALYMSKQLLFAPHMGRILGFGPFSGFIGSLYGAHTTVAIATAVAGLYTSLVYVTPIIGGLLADRVLGRTRTVAIGAIMMAIGHFLMAFDVSFLIALLFLVLGVGCFKGNIATQVGDLYAPDDLRRADAFQAYMLGIQIAVIISPLICGGLAATVGWDWGFGAAGVGMLIGLAVYLAGRKHLAAEPKPQRRSSAIPAPKRRLAPGEWTVVAVLVALLPVLALGAVGNQQIGVAYPIWGDQNLDLSLFGLKFPATFLQSLDAFVSAFTMAGSLAFWRWWATKRTEPNEITKLTIGTIIAAFAPLLLAAASLHAPGQKASLWWAIGFHIVNDIGFANVFPVGLALYSRAAPKAIGGTMIAVYYLFMFMCNNLVGWLGGLLDKLPGQTFWLIHAGLIGASAVLLIVARTASGRILAPTVDPEEALATA